MKKVIVVKKRISLHSKLRWLMSKNKDISITFVYPDKTIIKRCLNKEFLTNNGKPRNVDDIVNDIYAINHDRGSEYFII
jgi:hypothetical protein